MNKSLEHTSKTVDGHLTITGSKSESNRLLILKQIYPNIRLNNLSDSDDTIHLQEALSSNNNTIDIGHAGTAMRFLTAYFAVNELRSVTLTGSNRMQNRPIKILVDALKAVGADIEYLEKDGYPPLIINGKRITKSKVKINGNVSSQYISALLLIAPSLENGLEIELIGEVTSVPYIKMTLALLSQLEIETSWRANIISVKAKKKIEDKTITVESDWSSASYFYSLVALSNKGKMTLTSYKNNSLQGDRSLVEIYKQLGVETEFQNDSIILKKTNTQIKPIQLNLVNTPDLAQTIVVTCFGLGIACNLTGLHTLKIKETDRLIALQNELVKLGANIKVTNDSLHLGTSNSINKNIAIETYQDHRMAMAFAPLSLQVPLIINEAEVVTKSFATFWKDFENILS